MMATRKLQLHMGLVLEEDPRGLHVKLGDLLGEVTDMFYDFADIARLRVKHFNGEPWAIEPPAAAVTVLVREYSPEAN